MKNVIHNKNTPRKSPVGYPTLFVQLVYCGDFVFLKKTPQCGGRGKSENKHVYSRSFEKKHPAEVAQLRKPLTLDAESYIIQV